MMRKPLYLLWVGLNVSLMVYMAGCGGDSGSSGSSVTCDRVDGVWNAALDYGNGLVAHQSWIIAQSGCTFTMTGDPPDLYGVLLPAGTVSGGCVDNRLWADWGNMYAACRYSGSLDANINGNTLSGTIYWFRSPYGAGFCSSNSGMIKVTANR
jgi:hypothetical protein